MKSSIARLLISILLIVPGLSSPIHPELLKIVESPPIRIDTLEFSVVTQDQWRAVLYHGSKFTPLRDRNDEVILQLRIVNRGDKPIVVPTFDCFTAMLKFPDGKETALGICRDYTIITPSILLAPGQGYSYPMIARVLQPHDGDGIELLFADSTGGGSVTAMKPGNYSLYFKLHSTRLFNDRAPEDDLWITTGTTNPVTFMVLPAAR